MKKYLCGTGLSVYLEMKLDPMLLSKPYIINNTLTSIQIISATFSLTETSSPKSEAVAIIVGYLDWNALNWTQIKFGWTRGSEAEKNPVLSGCLLLLLCCELQR